MGGQQSKAREAKELVNDLKKIYTGECRTEFESLPTADMLAYVALASSKPGAAKPHLYAHRVLTPKNIEKLEKRWKSSNKQWFNESQEIKTYEGLLGYCDAIINICIKAEEYAANLTPKSEPVMDALAFSFIDREPNQSEIPLVKFSLKMNVGKLSEIAIGWLKSIADTTDPDTAGMKLFNAKLNKYINKYHPSLSSDQPQRPTTGQRPGRAQIEQLAANMSALMARTQSSTTDARPIGPPPASPSDQPPPGPPGAVPLRPPGAVPSTPLRPHRPAPPRPGVAPPAPPQRPSMPGPSIPGLTEQELRAIQDFSLGISLPGSQPAVQQRPSQPVQRGLWPASEPSTSRAVQREPKFEALPPVAQQQRPPAAARAAVRAIAVDKTLKPETDEERNILAPVTLRLRPLLEIDVANLVDYLRNKRTEKWTQHEFPFLPTPEEFLHSCVQYVYPLETKVVRHSDFYWVEKNWIQTHPDWAAIGRKVRYNILLRISYAHALCLLAIGIRTLGKQGTDSDFDQHILQHHRNRTFKRTVKEIREMLLWDYELIARIANEFCRDIRLNYTYYDDRFE